ncbi:MAG: lytic murein transglycosylase B [Burkholderiaceae bacterium]|nr:lytic murein transglycosylase B [Burkholderiaceae bacterium]
MLAPISLPAASAQAKRPPTSAPGTGATVARAAPDYRGRPDVDAFIVDMVARHGFVPAELEAMFAHVRRDDSVLRLIAPAPTDFRKSWRAYRARFLDPVRIREGVRFWSENESWLALASARYGVPPEIIVAIIGVETMYGRITGDVRVVDALATLAFDYPRRADYFRSELEQFLLYVRDERLDAFSLRGSFAGAIGLPQFMPGSIRRYAIDLDGDGHIDLRANPADAIGSVASFLAAHGWRSGEPVVFRARFDSESRLSPLVEAGIRPQFTLQDLAGYGVGSVEPVSLDLPLALIDLPNGDDATSYFLGAPNFYVITRYNRSSFYAMAVHDLARALAEAR